MYAYTGRKFDPDEWFVAVKQGHTFVTAGPMLEFTVDGKLPGDQLQPERGKLLKVHARAVVGSHAVPLGRLEIAVNGDVIRSADPVGTSAAIDFELPAENSMWIAARATGAHTTPVYVTVAKKRHWNLSEAPALLDKRLRTLDEMDRLIDTGGDDIGPGSHSGAWENREAFRRGGEELREMVREARTVYLELREEAHTQRSVSGPRPTSLLRARRLLPPVTALSPVLSSAGAPVWTPLHTSTLPSAARSDAGGWQVRKEATDCKEKHLLRRHPELQH